MSIKNLWFLHSVKPIDQDAKKAARQYQLSLTKPAGSLGVLETIAEQYAGWQGEVKPSIESIQVCIFAGDHGVCQQGVSAFPQEVTAQMVSNFLSGGAAISVLSESLGAQFSVVSMGTVGSLPDALLDHPQLHIATIAPSTNDFTLGEAMTAEQLEQALATGRQQVMSVEADIFIGGEMGIGNTTSASAIYAALLALNPIDVVGPGTGVDKAGLAKKVAVIEQALALHKTSFHNNTMQSPYDILRCVGGFEIAALVGAYIACAQKGVPVLVDGFICTAAALLAVRLNAGVRDWLLFSHCSAEPAHSVALKELGAQPLLDLGLRLGEGSGAALALPLVQSALLLHRQMATFEQADVSNGVSNKA